MLDEEALDRVPASVEVPAEADRGLPIALGRDVGPGSAFADEHAQGVGAVAFVDHLG